MNQGWGVVLPLIFFFLIDLTIFANSCRQREDTEAARAFTGLAGCIMLSQGLIAITCACDYRILIFGREWLYLFNLLALVAMTVGARIWFAYFMLTGKGTEKYLEGKRKYLLWIPVVLVLAAGIVSPWTHWLYYIDARGVYQAGTLYGLQFAGGLYYLAALILSLRPYRGGKETAGVLSRFALYLVPPMICVLMKRLLLRGGYMQIGCSYAIFLVYLDQYLTEVNENKRLRIVENLNRNLQNVNESLLEQMDIVGGLANAYFSVYRVNLKTGRCKPIKVIESFGKIVQNCHITAIVTNAFITACVMSEDKRKMQQFTDWHTLGSRLAGCDVLVEEFHGSLTPWEWCRASWIVASRDEEGKAENVLFTVEDVTDSVRERMRYEKEREQARKALEVSQAAAEAANKAKTNFLFNMSHDIRTPMNAIIGYADLMEKHFGEEEKCRDYLDKIKKSSDFLLSLVNNVLEMARIESGKMALEESVCKASGLIEQVISVYAELMEQKGLTFKTDIQVRTEYYYGDPVKLSEIFLNIVSNAYKYTNSGGTITLTVRERPSEKWGYILLETVVADTGIGMSEEYLPKLFEEFSRESAAVEDKIEGTGLGMPIVKKLVDLMKGTIEVESAPGKGTTFTITIPHRIAEAPAAQAETPTEMDWKKLEGKRILLAEDNELNREIATEVLQEFGFLVEPAEDGRRCVEKLTEAEAGYYDLILMDVQMPNLDGYEATRLIRSLPDKAKADIPILAMTANAFEEDRRHALSAGMNGHLAKPIEAERLLEAVAKVL